MADLSRLCFECMGEKGDHPVCPHCGKEHSAKQNFPLLPLGSLVGGRYYIGRAIRRSSESFTYIAYDTKLRRRCSVKEFFPDALAVRDNDTVNIHPAAGMEAAYAECREAFNGLWKKLQRLKGLTSLITVYDVFAAGNTTYAVSDETGGQTLREYLRTTPAGYLDWEQARLLFMPVLSTLGTLHTSGVLHRGLSPEAFVFTGDGRLKLTDFAIPQTRLAYGDLTADIHEGYAPLEVYTQGGSVGTWTDIYSFCAVLYRVLVGATPIPANVRAKSDQMVIPARFAERLPAYVINAMIMGMQIHPEDRTRNVEQLRNNLSATPKTVAVNSALFGSAQPLNIPTGNLRTAPGTIVPSAVKTSAPPRPVQRTAPQPQEPVSSVRTIYVDPLAGEEASRNPEHSAYAAQQAAARAKAEEVRQAREMAKKAKLRKRLIILLVFVILLLIAGLALVINALLGGRGGSKPSDNTSTELQMMSMPNFVGAQYDTVANQYYAQYLHIIRVDDNSATVPNGQIMYQSIAAGTTVSQGTEVILTVSTGPKNFTVPDVTGLTYEEALAKLAQEGLVCVRASKYNDGTHTPETVAETFPAAGEPIQQGAQIQVILWSPNLDELTSAENQTDANGNPVTTQPDPTANNNNNTTTAAPDPTETTAAP